MIFTLFSPTTKPSALNGQQLKIIFHLPFTQLLVNFPFSPEDTNQWQRKKKWQTKPHINRPKCGSRGFLVLYHFVMPTICCQYFASFFFVFFLVRCELLRWFAFNYAAIEKLLRVQQFRFQFIFSHLELGGVKGWVLGQQTTGFKFVTATTNMTNAK